MVLPALTLVAAIGPPADEVRPDPRAYAGPSAVSAPSVTGTTDAPDEPAAPEPAERATVVPAQPHTAIPTTPTPEPDQVRVVRVTTDALQSGTKQDAFRHAGGRKVVDGDDLRGAGAASVSEALDRTQGVRSVEGSSGQGSGPGTLSVAVRGVNPRLSNRTTVMLDEIPIAMAPYGQPQLSLFPISMFSIERIDVVRGGASVRFGPRTGGGVFNLISRPIPMIPRVSTFAQVDQFGEAQVGTAYAGTHRKLGVHVEYAPSFGRTYRDHSRFQIHGGLLKLVYPLTDRVELSSTTHTSWQVAELPGGLTPAQYQDDRFQSVRPLDERDGWRVGEGLKLKWQPRSNQELQTIGYYNHTFRASRLEQRADGSFLEQPRTYDAIGLEPRYTIRLEHSPTGPYHDLAFGVRGVYEAAELERQVTEAINSPSPDVLDPTVADARLSAFSFFVDDELYVLDEQIRVSAGLRGELVNMARRDQSESIFKRYWSLLPAGSLWFGPVNPIALFVGYGRSFTPPDFVEIAQESAEQDLRPEIIDSVDGGLKLQDLRGVFGGATAWFKNFQNLRDVGLLVPEQIGDARGWGVELELGWAPGDIWDVLGGSELYAGYAWTDTEIHRAEFPPYQGQKLAWYPAHELWGGLAYEFPWGCSLSRKIRTPADCRALRIGTDVSWTGSQFSEFTNIVTETADGTAGLIPGYALLGANVRWRGMLPDYWPFELTVGVKNLLDSDYYFRSDDINGGRMPQRPRTFYVNLAISHHFVRAWERAERKRERRNQSR